MGANGDAENVNHGPAPDFLPGSTSQVGGILLGVSNNLTPPSTNTNTVSTGRGDNLAPIPAAIGNVRSNADHLYS